MPSDARQEFEKWATDHGHVHVQQQLDGIKLSLAFEAWQASRNQPLVLMAMTKFQQLADFLGKDVLEVATTANLVQMVKDRRNLLAKVNGGNE